MCTKSGFVPHFSLKNRFGVIGVLTCGLYQKGLPVFQSAARRPSKLLPHVCPGGRLRKTWVLARCEASLFVPCLSCFSSSLGGPSEEAPVAPSWRASSCANLPGHTTDRNLWGKECGPWLGLWLGAQRGGGAMRAHLERGKKVAA